jgi:hypothetical protein
MKNSDYKEKWLISSQDHKLWKTIYQALVKREYPHCPVGYSVTDWIEYLKKQRISALVYNAIKTTKISQEEEREIFNSLKLEFLKLWNLNEIRSKEAFNVIKAISQKNIDVILMKGFYLQHYIYNSGEIRPSSDIDIMILDEKQFSNSMEIISQMGYKKFLYYSDSWERHFMKSVTWLPAIRGLYFEVDVHRSLVYNKTDKRKGFDLAFTPSEVYSTEHFRGIPVKIMTPAACFLYMSYHSFEVHSDCRSFLWLYDLILLSERFRKDDPLFIKLVEKTKTHDLMDYIFGLIDEMKHFNENNQIMLSCKVDRIHSFKEKFSNVNGIWNKAIWLMLWLFPSTEYLKANYDPDKSLVYLRYLYLWEKIKLRIKARKLKKTHQINCKDKEK